MIYILLLVTHNRVVRKCLIDKLLGLAHLSFVDLPQLDPFLSLFPIEAPNDIGAGPLHAEELLLKTGGLRSEVVDAGRPTQVCEEGSIGQVDGYVSRLGAILWGVLRLVSHVRT